ncbi:hypothetical protein [Pseudonocardia broussonetiae]|uniref:Uncharacterized protein n=1 Tax=Pseudonocardia broussonetiae TaxID=2736640 RepID=A0A6M6JJY1_9PSEU|nr:hypothetical protein [Pseudonocardia broussonetiae]QJY46922.1 hypothetical protein HOP40_14760 [Pseudonocardia broussonetiae]
MDELRRRVPVLVGAVSALLAAVLAVAAVLLAVQTAPTETAAQARAHLDGLVRAVAGEAVEPAVAGEVACPWLGVPGWPASRQVRSRVELAVPGDPAALVAAAVAAGEVVSRDASAVEVRAGGGYVLTVRTVGGGVLVGESPCVWPGGTREPVT